jgi:hypothetical protein
MIHHTFRDAVEAHDAEPPGSLCDRCGRRRSDVYSYWTTGDGLELLCDDCAEMGRQ